MRKRKKEGEKRRWAGLLLLLLLLPLLIWQGLRSGTERGGERPPTGSRPDTVAIDPDAGEALEGSYEGKTREEILAELERRQLLVTDTLSSHASFPSGEAGTLGEWMVENISGNEVIQQAEIRIGERCVARSAVLQPGQHVSQVRLLEEVPAGTHEAIAYLNYYTTDTQDYISKAGFDIRLTVDG